MDKFVRSITSRDEDFAQWYTDIVKKADMADYSSVKGCVILKPYGYAIWEMIQKDLDRRFRETGHENVYMPLFIPESLLQKEKEHVEGFAPEVAWVTHGGAEKLEERLCVRPTSETLFCEHYANTVQSYRDLPKLYNQWCSVVRWEKTTRPFLRTREFLWQEGHTAHATAEEAVEETRKMLDVYADFCREYLAIPVIKGKKTESEKFAGALETYSIESMMYDGKALQAGTSHNFGDGFARAFGIQYTDKNNELRYVHQTSWGVSTRVIGALIMVHGDDNGLVLPPVAAPVQIVIVPISTKNEAVMRKALELKDILSAKWRVFLDDGDRNPGWKFSEHEMRGVPVRLELGPRDLEAGRAVLASRDNGEKLSVSLDAVEAEAGNLMESIRRRMYAKAAALMSARTFSAASAGEFERLFDQRNVFVKAMWCGSEACERMIKEKLNVTSRNIPFEQEAVSDKCVCCGEAADKMVCWGRAY
ncbi:MAG: proline--tRNA ligase [Firmicutes bacterium]|nr:proline--tRNA ligase [Bacillota bacterium]